MPRFHISSRDNQHIKVVYDYDSAGILVEPMKNRQASKITRAWTHEPTLYVLNNEISYEFKQAFRKRDVSYQLVPPHVHRSNAAERAIRTFRNQFTSVVGFVGFWGTAR